jgi:hypothetical protein
LAIAVSDGLSCTLNSRGDERIPAADQAFEICEEGNWGRANELDAALGSYAPMMTGVPTSVTE